jgi:hypothetical protein
VAKGADTAVNAQAVTEWIRAAGPAPESDDIRRWLHSLVPEYQSTH